MNNSTLKTVKTVTILCGILLIFLGLFFDIGLLVYMGVMGVFFTIFCINIKEKMNSASGRYGQIKSGTMQNMNLYNRPKAGSNPVANYANISALPYNSVSVSKAKTDNVKYDECDIDGCNLNECPICKTFSVSGYCSACGFKFRH